MVTVPGFLIPGFLVPGLLVPGFSTNSYMHSRPARKNTANQNLLRQNFIAYIFRSKSASPPLLTSLGARGPERQSARAQSKSSIVYIFRSKRASPPKQKRNPVPIKESYPSPRMYHSLIGCSPWPSCHHGEGRAHGVENYPWHMRRLFVYHLEHSCQRHLVTANVEVASHKAIYEFSYIILSFFICSKLFF